MQALSKLLLATCILLFLNCGTSTTGSKSKTTPLFAKDTTNEIEKNNTLFVFVGEKIFLATIPYKPGDLDNGVKARYKILERVYGNYDNDVIDFEAYDHYETPAFTKFKTVLLFVSKLEGKYYQQKYVFHPVARTKDGRWAGPFSREYEHPNYEHTTIKPQKINFIEKISFPTKVIDQDGKETIRTFPEPYFKIVGDSAITVYGNYIEDLFKRRRDGILTARRLFPDPKKED